MIFEPETLLKDYRVTELASSGPRSLCRQGNQQALGPPHPDQSQSYFNPFKMYITVPLGDLDFSSKLLRLFTHSRHIGPLLCAYIALCEPLGSHENPWNVL